MNAFKTTAIVEKGNVLKLKEIPFNEGEQVEVIILEKSDLGKKKKEMNLRGSVKRFDRPFAPVSEDDWEADR
jgi:predicted DNA-binding antitoxin AbrB/MazE fold protein